MSEIEMRFTRFTYAFLLAGVVAVVSAQAYTQYLTMQEIKSQMTQLSLDWQGRVATLTNNLESEVASLRNRLDNLPPPSLVTTATKALELAAELERRVDAIEKKAGDK